MVAKLEELVAIKLAPNKDETAKELRVKYAVSGYPTMVFVDTEGNEVDRLMGFIPPTKFVGEIQRIQSGDTFVACLERLGATPGDPELLSRVVRGLLDRNDVADAYNRLDAFSEVEQEGLEDNPAQRLQMRVMASEHSSLYRKVGRQYRSEWQETVDVSESRSTPGLADLLETDLTELDRDAQADQLREARKSDAQEILHMLPNDVEPGDAYDVARFAYSNGHFEAAGGLYSLWYDTVGDSKSSGALNAAAWNLYLSRTELELAVEMAQDAYAEDQGPGVADTLARLLYITDHADEAIEIQSKAAAESEGKSAEEFAAVVETMKAGDELSDKPEFESYPG